LAALHRRLLPGGVARRLCRRHRRAHPLRLSGARPGDAAPRAGRGDPGRERQPARLARGQLDRGLSLQLRPGHVSRARLRRALLAHAHRAGGAAAGPVRTAGAVRRLAALVALVVLAAFPLWVSGTYYVNIASQILFYAIFALGVNVLAGHAGLVTLGHAGLFGIAAYLAAKTLNAGYGPLTVPTGPFGASVRGTRDQPRRMNALGYHVWMIRFLAFLFSAFWSGVAGLLYLYYNQFVSPQAVALTASAEALLMVIAGGSATLLGPIAGAGLVVVMKNVASAYIERWNFVLGAIFVAIVVFMPEGLVPGVARLARRARGRTAAPAVAAVPAPGEGPAQ